MCAYFNFIPKAHCEYTGGTWSYYDANYRQRAAATHSKNWSVTDTTLFSQQRKLRAVLTAIRHETIECPQRKGKRQTEETKIKPKWQGLEHVLQLELPSSMPFQPMPLQTRVHQMLSRRASIPGLPKTIDKERIGTHAPRPFQTLTFTL